MAKKLIMSLFSTISIFCMVYYSCSFYQKHRLVFDDCHLLPWVVIITMTIISLIVGLVAVWRVENVEKQNNEMKSILLQLAEDSEEYYDSLCHHLQNSRELSLDIFDKMQEKK